MNTKASPAPNAASDTTKIPRAVTPVEGVDQTTKPRPLDEKSRREWKKLRALALGDLKCAPTETRGD